MPWDMQIYTGREIAASKPDVNQVSHDHRSYELISYIEVMNSFHISLHKPDIVIKDHKNKTCKLIDIAVPSDKNNSLKTTEKLAKY